ncbi:MAG: MFS transporter [Planctomycetes bacterium]|nr:MFS transporter [Planctomycetota bacterium]
MTAAADGPLDLLATPGARVAVWALGALVTLVMARELRRVPRRLVVLMATAFLDMVGLFLVLPLLPFYVQQFAGDGITLPWLGRLGVGALTGMVVSAYTVAQLLSAPWWGRLSDRVGRRPVLMIALGAAALAFLILAAADSLWLLLLSRLVQGAGGGTVAVVQAYVADTIEPAQRTRALGWLSAATNLGVALGPALGAVLVDVGHLDLWPGAATVRLGAATPGLGAALLCLLNLWFAATWLRESRAAPAGPRTTAPLSARGAAWQVLTRVREPASRLIWIYGIAIGSFQGISAVLALFLHARWAVTEQTIGYVFLYIGAISVLARVLLLGPLVDRLGEARLARAGIVTLAAGLAGMALAGSLPGLALAVALLPLGTSFTFPCVTALLSGRVAAADRGLYLGLQQTFGGASRLLAPLAYGWAYDALGRTVPFHLAALLVLSTLAFTAGLQPPAAPPPAEPAR